MPQKLDVLSALCEQLSESHESLRDHGIVVAKVRTARKARNTFLHNVLSQPDGVDSMQLVQASARGKVKASAKPITTSDIRRVLVDVHLAQLALYKLVLGKERLPIWEQPRPDPV